MKNVHIDSIGYHIPGRRLTNDEVLSRVRACNEKRFSRGELDFLIYSNKRKFEFLGIETRSACADPLEENTVSMALSAIGKALLKIDAPASRIDCLIACGVSNPFREPTLSLALAAKLPGFGGSFFDLNDTCNGFMKSMDVAGRYIRAGAYENVLVVSSENPYEMAAGLGIDYTLNSFQDADCKFSSLLAGCGAAAALLSADGGGRRIVDYTEKRETNNWSASLFTPKGITIPGFGGDSESPGVWTDARLVSAQVIKDLPEFARETVGKWNMSLEDFDIFVMHQLGNNVTYATLDRLGLPRERAPVNTFKEYGNMASANIPVNLAISEETGTLTPGDSVLLMSSACGLSYSLMHLEW